MIGYYAHHHGSGHVTRAVSIAECLDEPLTILSSRKPRSSVDWVELPLDTDPDIGDYTPAHDCDVNGLAHWAPLGVRGLTDRMAAIAAWIAAARPRVFVVDVSVEVAVFVRLLGIPVVVMAMPGTRDDGPHRLAYGAATAIVAPWSRGLYEPPWLDAYAEKTTFVGAISRFDGRRPERTREDRTVVVLGGAGGTSLAPSDIREAADCNPEYRWTSAGIDSWVEDVWPLLCAAAVVVTHAGQNAVADIAAAGASAIVIPQSRPYDEQKATAAALLASGSAVVAEKWPEPTQWTTLLTAAGAHDATSWKVLEQPGAAGRAADAIAAAGLR